MFYITINREHVGTDTPSIKITRDGDVGDSPGFLCFDVDILGVSRMVTARNAEHRAPGHPNRAAWLETDAPLRATVRLYGVKTFVLLLPTNLRYDEVGDATPGEG